MSDIVKPGNTVAKQEPASAVAAVRGYTSQYIQVIEIRVIYMGV